VQSVNGPEGTAIQGAWDPSKTNGPLAVRCAWLTNGATLSGFTLRGGATRAGATSPDSQQSGGGAWANSSSTMLVNCIVISNSAAYWAGGVFQATINNSTLIRNRVGPGVVANGGNGGGAANCTIKNSLITGNFALLGGSSAQGGGA